MKYLIHAVIAFIFVCIVASCDDMNSIHQKYLDEGEAVYIGYPDIVAARAGYGRIQLEWKINADPKIDGCCIYWNDRKDSMTVTPDRTVPVMEQVITLPEGKYILEIVNKSKDGYRSLAGTVSGESYGEEYKNSLYNRTVTEVAIKPGKVIFTWAPEEGCVGVNLSYTNSKDQTKEVFIKSDQTVLELDDFVVGGTYTYSSLYVPEAGAIDTVASNTTTSRFPNNPPYYTLSKEEWEAEYHADYADIDRTGWIASASTEEIGGEGPVNGRVATILDGNLSTFWHTQWQGTGANPPVPHTINIDMLESKTVSSIELARRSNNRDTKKVVFYISEDNSEWNEIGYLDYPNATTPNAKVILLPDPVTGRYFRIVVTECNNASNASLSEVMLTTPK